MKTARDEMHVRNSMGVGFLENTASMKFSRLLIPVGMTAIGIILIIAQAVCFSILWKWFITPYGAPTINIDAAVGIACIFVLVKGLFFGGQYFSRQSILMSIARIGLIFVIAYAAHMHMFSGLGMLKP